jgi:hypothetical protein
MNNKGKELAAMKIVSTIKCMLNKKPKEPIYLERRSCKKSQENHNSQKHQDQRCEEERKSPEDDRDW